MPTCFDCKEDRKFLPYSVEVKTHDHKTKYYICSTYCLKTFAYKQESEEGGGEVRLA